MDNEFGNLDGFPIFRCSWAIGSYVIMTPGEEINNKLTNHKKLAKTAQFRQMYIYSISIFVSFQILFIKYDETC